MTAAELVEQLAQDPGYQERKAKFDSELENRVADWRRAEAPLVADLRRVGIDVESVWDLVNAEEPYAAALPILVQYLEVGDLPDRVLEGVGRSLAVKPAVEFWDRLLAVMKSEPTAGHAEGVAVAMAGCATPDHISDLIAMIVEMKRTPAHIHLLRPIYAHGGDLGRSCVKSLLEDPILAKEASILMSAEP